MSNILRIYKTVCKRDINERGVISRWFDLISLVLRFLTKNGVISVVQLAWGNKGVESGETKELKLRPSRSKGTEITPFFVKNLKTKLIKSNQREITPLSFLYII
jgi:hypothetical protein